MMPIARLLGFLVCGSIGYFTAHAWVTRDEKRSMLGGAGQNAEAKLRPLTADPAESKLVADWERLRAQHGGDSADMDTLYQAVKDEKDPFRRRAYRSALIAEWSARDPRSALAYLLEKDTWQAVQLAREWMRIDPDAAINGLIGGGPKARKELRGILSEIARVAPGRLAEAVAATPKPEGRWDTSALEAFAIFAQKDLEAARLAAESMSGELRGQVLAGVAKAWAEQDGPAALAWAQALAAGEARDGALKAALTGWAKKEPMAALDHIDVVPPGGEEYYYGSDVGSQVLREAGKKDWDATVKWLVDHPGKLGRPSLDGLRDALTHRMSVDVGGTLRSMEKSGLPGIEHVFGNAILNDGYMQRDAVWTWLEGQPKTPFTDSIRSSVLNAIGWKEPEVALGFLDKISDKGEERGVLERAAQSMLNGGQQFDRVERLLEKASAKVRPFLLEAAFNYVGEERVGADPEMWVARLDQIPVERRANATGSVARAWTNSDPQAASQWALAQPVGELRQSAVSNVASIWAQQDPRTAATWVNTLPQGVTRDTATVAMVHTMAQTEPESAWTWALSVESSENRMSALQSAYANLRRKDPGIAAEMLQSANLSPGEKQTIQSIPDRPPGGSYYRPF